MKKTEQPGYIHPNTKTCFAVCKSAACANFLTQSDVTNKYVRCKGCRGRTLHGRLVRNDDLWAMREFCVGRAKERQVPLMACRYPGCTNTYQYNLLQRRERKCCQKHGLWHRKKSWSTSYNCLKNMCRRTGRTLKITFEQFQDICDKNKDCIYCGLPVSRRPSATKNNKKGAHAYCLDKINPENGYTVDNVVTACFTCNLTKMDLLSPQEAMIVGRMRVGKHEEAADICRQQQPPNAWPSSTWAIDHQDATNRLHAKRERTPEQWAKQVALMQAGARKAKEKLNKAKAEALASRSKAQEP